MSSMRTGILLAVAAVLAAGCANSVRRAEVLHVVDVYPAPIEVARGLEGAPLVLVSDETSDDLGAPPAPGGLPIEDAVVIPPTRPDSYVVPEGGWAMPDELPVMEEPPAPAPPMPPAPVEEVPLEVIEPPAVPGDMAPRLTRTPVVQPFNACNTCAPDPCGCGDGCPEGYVGMSGNVLPGLGFGMQFGYIFERTPCIIWSVEGGMSYHDMTNIISPDISSAKMFMANVGVRALFLPQSRIHPILTAGVGWYHATGAPGTVEVAQIDFAGDYLGGYVGFGAMYELSDRWTTGPEFRFWLGSNIEALPARSSNNATAPRGKRHFSYIPMVYWHVHYNF